MSDIDFTATAIKYAVNVGDGTVLACKQVRQACKRFLDDRANSAWQYRYDESIANRVCRFVSLMPHAKGKWGLNKESLKLEPWQIWILCNVFGFVDKETGLRRFRKAFIIIPRKNGKSCLSAAVGLYAFVADNEYGAEVFSGAGSEKQAWATFRQAKIMASTASFKKRFGVTVNAKSLVSDKSLSRFEPIIGMPGDGDSPSFAIIDEYHEHDKPTLRNAMQTGFGAREQPILWTITTAGDNLAGPCYDDILTGRHMLEKSIDDDQLFFVEYTIDPETDWASDDAMKMANPNMGVSVFKEYLISQRGNAIRNPRDQAVYQTKHLCQWVNSRVNCVNMQSWNTKCYDKTLKITDMNGKRCIIGADLAAKQDICALQLLFPDYDGKGNHATFGLYYLPEAIITKSGNDHYQGWFNKGKIRETDGGMVDFDVIMKDLEDCLSLYNVTDIVFDPAQANWFMGACMKRNLPVFQFIQYKKYFSEPMKQMIALIDEGKIKHDQGPNDPMSWMMSNVVAKKNTVDEIAPDKERDELKIDGPVALIMALSRAEIAPKEWGNILSFV